MEFNFFGKFKTENRNISRKNKGFVNENKKLFEFKKFFLFRK